jgi:hypothetical protein
MANLEILLTIVAGIEAILEWMEAKKEANHEKTEAKQ